MKVPQAAVNASTTRRRAPVNFSSGKTCKSYEFSTKLVASGKQQNVYMNISEHLCCFGTPVILLHLTGEISCGTNYCLCLKLRFTNAVQADETLSCRVYFCWLANNITGPSQYKWVSVIWHYEYWNCYVDARSCIETLTTILQDQWRSNGVGRVGKVQGAPEWRGPRVPGKFLKNNFSVTVKLRHLLLIPTMFYCNTPNFSALVDVDGRLTHYNNLRLFDVDGCTCVVGSKPRFLFANNVIHFWTSPTPIIDQHNNLCECDRMR